LNPNEVDEDDDTKTDTSNGNANGNGVKKQRREAAPVAYNGRSLLIDIPTVCYDLSLSFLSVRDLCQVSHSYE
jgi:hypothetical protein